MNAKKTPLQQVNEEHGGKAKLVDKVLDVIERGEEEASELKARLLKASNKQLLRLMAVGNTIKEKYGSAQKLADAVAQKLGKAKDKDFMTRLQAYSPAKLLDLARSLGGEKRRPPKVTPSTTPPKASAKKPAAKKPVAKKGQPAKKPAKKPVAKKPAARSKKS